jgi:hypothetical protein
VEVREGWRECSEWGEFTTEDTEDTEDTERKNRGLRGPQRRPQGLRPEFSLYGVMSDLKVRPYALAMAGVQKAAAPLHSKRAQALAVAARS